VVAIDLSAPVRFLRSAFEPTDSIGVLLKTYRTGQVIQRLVPVDTAVSDRFQSWLRYLNSHGWNVYVGVNAYRQGRSRARSAIAHVRHLFLEEDVDGPGLLAALSTRPDLPPPSYVLHSSPGRLHVMWRVRDIAASSVELLQKQLARELLTDRAATSCAQTTRLPGFFNHKRKPSVPVAIEYLRWHDVFTAADLPVVHAETHPQVVTAARRALPGASRAERARAFLERVGPAVSGQCGDLQTFRVCCRIVRGFDLTDEEAVRVLREWNARCEPPWTEHELRQKVANARKYGREPLGGLL
jgi:hypothetical protein